MCTRAACKIDKAICGCAEEKEPMDSPSDICVICQDTLGDPASHVKLECGHVLHGQCMVDALTRSLRCPICRFNLSKNTLPNIVFWSYDPPTGIGTSYISRPSYRVGAAPPPVAAPLARASRRLLRTRTSPCALRPTLRARFSVRHGRKGNVPTPEPTSPRRLCFAGVPPRQLPSRRAPTPLGSLHRVRAWGGQRAVLRM